MKFPVVIPSAVDDAGLAEDYFSLGNINLLPLVHKTLIEYLLDDLQKKKISDLIGKIYLIVGEKQKGAYKEVIGERKGVHIISQAPYEKKGILTTVNKVMDEIGHKPFMIIYGDTIVKNGVLRQMIESAKHLSDKKKKNWGVIALIKDHPQSSVSGWLERNRHGYIVVDSKKIRKLKDYQTVDEEAIRDIVYRPSYVSLLSRRPDDEFLIESGAMIICPSLWKKFTQVHERDPLGLHSIINSARYCFVTQGFTLRGIVIKRGDWLDINYPWEYLKANDYLSQWLRKYKEGKEKDPDLIDRDYAVVASKEELLKLYSAVPEVSKIKTELPSPREPAHEFSNEYDSEVWGIHEDAVIDGYVAVPDPRKIGDTKIFLGRNAQIKGNCVIKKNARIRSNATVVNSVIGENVLIDSYVLIDHSVIMDNSEILYSSAIPYSVVGRNVVIGGNSTIACERIDSNNSRPNKYYSAFNVIEYSDRFGAIIGDGVKMGVNTYVQPGRKIGKRSIIYPGNEIIHNILPGSIVKKETQLVKREVKSFKK